MGAYNFYCNIFFLDGLSNNFKSPCVVFTGHPSLRYGDAVHFVELWRRDSKSTVIFIGTLLLYLLFTFLLR